MEIAWSVAIWVLEMKAKTRLPKHVPWNWCNFAVFFALALLFCRGFLGHQMDQPGPSKLTLSPRLFAGVAWKFAQIWSNGGGKVTECLFKTPWPNFIFRELYGQIDHVQNISVLQAAFNGFSTIVTWHHIGTMKGSNETLGSLGIPDD